MKTNRILPIVAVAVAAAAMITGLTACAVPNLPGKKAYNLRQTVRSIVDFTIQPSTAPSTAPATTEPATEPPTTAPVTTEPATAPPATAPVEQPAGTPAERVYAAARDAVARCTADGMTKEEKLRAAFRYLQQNYLEGVRRSDYREPDWPVVYASDILISGKGDCYSYGAAFAYMAKAIGCADCYACNSGGHGWAEVEGRIYDPEWSLHSQKYSYFGMSYSDPSDVPYRTALGTAAWMRIAV